MRDLYLLLWYLGTPIGVISFVLGLMLFIFSQLLWFCDFKIWESWCLDASEIMGSWYWRIKP